MLVDVGGESDHLASMAQVLCDGLRAEGLHLHRFHYRRDLRFAFAVDGEHWVELDAIVNRMDGQRMIVFGEAEALARLLTDRAWSDQLARLGHLALLTPRHGSVPCQAEIAVLRHGVSVEAPDVAGLIRLADQVARPDQKWASRRDRVQLRAEYPAILGARPSRWLDDTPPEPKDAETLIAQLRAYLGREGYRWLAATAAFPRLALPITLQVAGPAGARVGALPALASLPWFRAGRLPDWLRLRLLDDLPKSRAEAVRTALGNIFVSAADTGDTGGDLRIARHESSFTLRLMRRLLRAQPADSPLREHIFMEFLGLRPRAVLGIAAPRRMAALLRPEVAAALADPSDRSPDLAEPLQPPGFVIQRIEAAVRWLAYPSIMVLFATLGIAMIEIIARFGVGQPIIWGIDVMTALNPFFAIGAAWFVASQTTDPPGRRGHVVAWLRQIILVPFALPFLGYTAFNVWNDAAFSYIRDERTPTIIALPTWPSNGLAAFALSVLCAQMAAEALRALTRIRTGSWASRGRQTTAGGVDDL